MYLYVVDVERMDTIISNIRSFHYECKTLVFVRKCYWYCHWYSECELGRIPRGRLAPIIEFHLAGLGSSKPGCR